MARRRQKDSQFELPAWLVELLKNENPEQSASSWRGRIASAGVVELGCDAPDRPNEITFRGPRLRGRVPVSYARTGPVTYALGRLVDVLANSDRLIRLRLAAGDMESVGFCARELAQYRHTPGAPEPLPHSPYVAVEEVLEAGLVVVYARSFMGKASLGDNWRPAEGEDRKLHDALMLARSHIHAHADHTAYRTLVDTNRLLGLDGPPTFGLAQNVMPAEGLRAVAGMCERQGHRFTLVADELEQDVRAAIESGQIETVD